MGKGGGCGVQTVIAATHERQVPERRRLARLAGREDCEGCFFWRCDGGVQVCVQAQVQIHIHAVAHGRREQYRSQLALQLK